MVYNNHLELLNIGLSTSADYIFQLKENIYWEMTVMFVWKYFFPHSVWNMELCVSSFAWPEELFTVQN